MISMILEVAAGRPYFGTAAAAFQSPPVRHGYMQALIAQLAQRRTRPLRVLEVGSWAGASAITWASALSTHGGGTVTCVDPWQPYFDLSENGSRAHYRRMNEAAATGDIMALFHYNVRVCGVGDQIEAIRGRSADILPTLPGGSFDVVYLDGSHRYEDVLEDLRLAMRLVRRGGVLCGDDLEAQRCELDEEGTRLMLESGQDFVRRGAAGASFHPGVTRAVAEALGEVSAWEGFWAARRRGGRWQPLDLAAEKIEVPKHLRGAATAGCGPPQGIGSVLDRDLVLYDGSVLAIPRRLGAVDPDLIEAWPGAAGESAIVSSETVDGALLGVHISELESAVAPLGDGLRNVGEDLGRVRSDLERVRSELGTFEGVVSAVASIAEPVANRMLAVETEVEQLRSELLDAATAFSAAHEPLQSLPVQMAEIDGELHAARTDIVLLGQATTAVQAQIERAAGDLQAGIDRVAHEVAPLGPAVADLGGSLERLAPRLDTLHGEVSVLTQTVARMEGTVEDLLGRTEMLKALSEKSDELARGLGAVAADVLAMRDRLAPLLERIPALEAYVRPLRAVSILMRPIDAVLAKLVAGHRALIRRIPRRSSRQPAGEPEPRAASAEDKQEKGL